MAAHPFDPLARESYLSLATFRRDGRAVETPVWFARRGERLYLFTARDAGKVKRLRRDAHARVAPCTGGGRITGPAIEASARVVSDPALEREAYAALLDKYGWQMRLTNFFSGLTGRIRNRAVIEVSIP